MKFVEFKLPKKLGTLLSTDYYISYIITDEKGFRIAFYHNKNDIYDIVFDFEHTVEDYRVSKEGRRLDHHMDNVPKSWLFIEVKDSEYLKKIDKESSGILLIINPNLKHYMAGDIDYSVDIISRAEPKVYQAKSTYKEKKVS